MKHVRYFSWNTFITGTLVAGYLLDEMSLSGKIIGVVYVFIFALLLIAFLASFVEDGRLLAEGLNKAGYSWHIITDIIFIISAGHMGYKKIAVCMFVELAVCLYLTIWAKVKKGEDENADS